ncbi:hypothetical protein ACFOS1_16345 [Zunongwangia endophytica]|uniref:Uncharacterized protein n=1 Tax=Zunongwangia endophytica TaxID=1808945 RepID=A0ABV8HF98_9FLAO
MRKKEIQLELIKNDMNIEKHAVQIDKKQRIYWILLGTAMGIGAYELLKYTLAFLYDKI